VTGYEVTGYERHSMKYTSTQRRKIALALSFGLFYVGAQAQLNSPIGDAIPSGTSVGVHSPKSPFAPLPGRTDALPWSVLTAIKTKVVKNRLLLVFPDSVKELHQTNQRIQGFMIPLEPGEKQKHFLLSSVPLTCSFCFPGGPESMVEVKTKTPVKYTIEPVLVEGQFMVLQDDPMGLYYRVIDAISIK
jgi:hypothetical protein